LIIQAFELWGLISIALSNAVIASSDLFNLVRAIPLFFQTFEFCGLISIALSNAVMLHRIYLI
jgi:hypothetical protein